MLRGGYNWAIGLWGLVFGRAVIGDRWVVFSWRCSVTSRQLSAVSDWCSVCCDRFSVIGFRLVVGELSLNSSLSTLHCF